VFPRCARHAERPLQVDSLDKICGEEEGKRKLVWTENRASAVHEAFTWNLHVHWETQGVWTEVQLSMCRISAHSTCVKVLRCEQKYSLIEGIHYIEYRCDDWRWKKKVGETSSYHCVAEDSRIPKMPVINPLQALVHL
jgi:hypothetical protein